jgi:hypothetical protein
MGSRPAAPARPLARNVRAPRAVGGALAVRHASRARHVTARGIAFALTVRLVLANLALPSLDARPPFLP